VRQSIQDLGATAFETLYSMIRGGGPASQTHRGRDIALPAAVMRRESCGCSPQASVLRRIPGQPPPRAQANRAPAPGNAEEAE
jgi:hypothetical protein